MKNKNRAGFTLIELMVVVAIISILAAVALPAYNNYTLRSKFSEVVLATGPTKTAISACAVAGDCVSGSAISLVSTTGTAGALVASSTPTPNNANEGALWAFLYAFASSATNPTTAAGIATGSAPSYVGLFYVKDIGGGNVCMAQQSDSVCFPNLGTWPLSQVSGYVNASNPFLSSALAAPGSTTTFANLPCVGPATTGCSPPTKYAASVSYDAVGVITATAQSTSGLNAETFVLTPALSGGRVDWAASGTCKTRAGGALC